MLYLKDTGITWTYSPEINALHANIKKKKKKKKKFLNLTVLVVTSDAQWHF